VLKELNKNVFYFLLFIAMIAWGASWVNAKVLSGYINEYELIFLRNFFTIITLGPVLIITKKYFYIDKKSLVLAILASIVMIAYMKGYFLGTKFGTASLGGALVTTLIPINTFLIMAIFFGKKIQKKDSLALLIGAIGVLTILNIWTFSYEQIFTIQNAYFIIASLLWPILTIISSKAVGTSPMVFTFYMYIITTIMVLVFFMDIDKIPFSSFDTIFWVNILNLSIVSTTFATTIYFVGIEKLGTNEVSSFIFLVPFSAITLGAIFLDEDIGISIIIGTFLTIIAVKNLNNMKLIRKK